MFIGFYCVIVITEINKVVIEVEGNKYKRGLVNNAMRRERMADKMLENSPKLPLISKEVIQTADYIFSSIKPLDRIGDSGSLLLAKCKSDRNLCYFVKHAYADCAANEFVYTKLAQAMGTKMPDAVLFQISDGEKRRYFQTEYIIGLKYLDITIEAPTYSQIREQADNWQDFFRFRAMYDMFLESDSFETPLVSDGFIYRVDTTDAFPLCDLHLSQAGLNIVVNGNNVKEIVQKYVESIEYNQLWKYTKFENTMNQLAENCGKEGNTYFSEPFNRIQEVSNDYIDDFLNTLCYIYPDFIGDYFKSFIAALQKKSREYLKSVNV